MAGNPAGMINPSLPVFVREQPGVLLKCQDNYLSGRGGPQKRGQDPPTDVVERKRSLPVVLAHQHWPNKVYPLLP